MEIISKISIKLDLKNLVNNLTKDYIEFLKKKFLNYQNEKNFFIHFSEYNYQIVGMKVQNIKDKSLIIHYPHSPWITFLKILKIIIN